MGSLLDNLKTRRQQLLAEASTADISIPGWQGAMKLRIHPLDHQVLRKYGTKVAEAKRGVRANLELTTSAAIVALATDVVLIDDLDDPSAEQVQLPLTDPDLLDSLELSADAVPLSILRALALGKDGVVLQLAGKVQELSGYAEIDADEAFAGE